MRVARQAVLRGALVCALGALGQAALGRELAPPPEPIEIAGKATARGWPVTRLFLSAQQVDLASGDLAATAKFATETKVETRGEGEERERWTCYLVLGTQTDTTLWFVARGSREPARVDEIVAVRQVRGEKIPLGCERLPTHMQPASFDRWLWLGLPEREVVRRLGAPSSRRDDWVRYAFDGVQARKVRTQLGREETVRYASAASLELRYAEGRVVSIRARGTIPRQL